MQTDLESTVPVCRKTEITRGCNYGAYAMNNKEPATVKVEL